MDSGQRLKEFLQVQLASDSSAVLHLPFVLEAVAKEDFTPSTHTQKWIARLNSLIHARDPAAKWAGLCLAFQTAAFSRDLMLECAQGWVGSAMPLLVNQPPPTTKATIRLLRLVFTSAMDVPEFQRQLCVPNVPKFVNALVVIAEKENDQDVLSAVIQTLTHVVSLYPSLCRPLHNSISNVALRSLNGSAPTPVPRERVEECSRLYAALPLTGGKVNAPGLWHKSLEDTTSFAWGAFLQLRITYPNRGQGNVSLPRAAVEDPIIAVPLALDRLRAAVRVIEDLLRSNIPRPVSLSVGPLVRLCTALLQCAPEEKPEAHVDHVVHTLERSTIPIMWELAYRMLASVSKAGQHHLTPHIPALLTALAGHLEQPRSPSQVSQCLQTSLSLLKGGAQLHDIIVASRLVRAILPRLAVLLSTRSQADAEGEQGHAPGRSKKGKKRARGYEGDEVFKIGREIVCPTADECDAMLTAVDLLKVLLVGSHITPPVRSIASRLLLSIHASLSHLPPAILSPDLSLHRKLHAKVQSVCMSLAIGTTSTMSKSLGLILSVSDHADGDMTELDILLHPRVPPLVRSLPHVEMLSLYRAEEGEEEVDARQGAGLATIDEYDLGEPNVAAGSQTPHTQIQKALSSALHQAPDSARIPGPSAPQESNVTAMQVDATPTASSALSVSRTSAHAIALKPPSQTTLEPPTSLGLAQTSSPPPPPDPLPSSTAALGLRSIASTTSTIPAITPVAPVAAPAREEDDEDEPMPAIDLGSDSESE